MRQCPVLLTAMMLLTCGLTAHAQIAPAVSVPVAAKPATDPAKEKAIRQLLQITGTAKLMHQMEDQMFTSMQSTMTDVPTEVWTKMRARFQSDELIDLLIPVYDKNYTTQELDGLIAFYQSPLGQKVIATLPQVNRESMAIGQAWGQKQAKAVIAEIEREKKDAEKHSKTKSATT